MSALTPKDRFDLARMGGLRRRLEEQVARDAEVTESTARAAELQGPDQVAGLLAMSDADLAEKGWTRGELVIAIDAKQSWAHVPAYLRMTHERHLTRLKAAAERTEGGAGAREFIIPGVRPPAPELPPAEDDE